MLAFCGHGAAIVSRNLAERFVVQVPWPEARCFYNFQETMENIHLEACALLVDTYMYPLERDLFFYTVEKNSPAIRRKTEWCLRWVNDRNTPFVQRLLAFAIIQCVFFSASSHVILRIKEEGKLPGLCSCHDLIYRDEKAHVAFAVMIYSQSQDRPPTEAVATMMTDAVRIEQAFVRYSMPEPMWGLDAEQLETYVERVADGLMVQLGYEPLFQIRETL